MKMTIGDYLIMRLKELGIDKIFGVPGDFNLSFLDQIELDEEIKWIGTCNELNGAYAADGYARIKGIGALVTTYGVGELSAINGIAGAYAEHVPIVNIVGMPALSAQENGNILHHTLGDGKEYDVFMQMYSKISIAQTQLTIANAAAEIDRVLELCSLRKRPCYIGVPSDLFGKEIETTEVALSLLYPTSDPDKIKEVVTRMVKLISNAERPVLLLDHCALRFSMKPLIAQFIQDTHIPFANMNMGKGILSELHEGMIGTYNGVLSTPGTQEYVESSDCVIAFGTLLSDFNTAGFTVKINVNASIEIHSNFVRMKHSHYSDLYFIDVIPALNLALKEADYQYHYQHAIEKYGIPTYIATKEKLTQARFWRQIEAYLREGDILIPEAGTSLFGALSLTLPHDISFLSQLLWGSIGYTVGATLGAVMAAPNRRTILIIGDGSFQLTAQELSTMIRHKTAPIIILINNDGYTVERVIHGEKMAYNDIQMWKYAEFPRLFGEHQVWSACVETEETLANALIAAENHNDKLRFIEVVMDKLDAPELLKKIGKISAKLNSY